MAKAPLSRVWILTFFVMGIIIGLLLLLLDRGLSWSWPQLASAPEVEVEAAKEAPALNQPLLCDRDEAQTILHKARTLASISERDGMLELQLSRDWEYYSAGHRRGFVEAFSEADRCLQGRFRAIHLFYRGEEVATVGSAGKIEMK